ncbi:hypothetical protein NKDENANG_00433 [Candidatus Entotheonellaceae bacterium PAL068K]
MSFDEGVILLMVVGLVIFVGEPLVRLASEPGQDEAERSELDQLTLQKETVYTAIHDLDFDFRTGKVDDQDYTVLRRHLEDEAIQLLRRIDDVDPLAVLDDELERQILAFRQSQTSDADRPAQSVCRRCTAALEGGENFCPACGQPLIPA